MALITGNIASLDPLDVSALGGFVGDALAASVGFRDTTDASGLYGQRKRPIPSRTVRDLIRRSLRLIGAIGTGERVDDNDAQDALLALNQMIDAWSTDNLFLYQTVEQSFNLTAGKAYYTIGQFGDLNTVRPIGIQYAFTRDEQSLDRQLRLVSQEDYSSITLKNIGETFPWALTNDNAYPLSTLTLYPYPQGNLSLYLGMLQPLSGYVTINDLVNLPPGYEEAIVYSLAEQVAPEYQRQLSPQATRMAAMARGRIKSLNLPTAYLACEFAGINSLQGYGDGKAAFYAGDV